MTPREMEEPQAEKLEGTRTTYKNSNNNTNSARDICSTNTNCGLCLENFKTGQYCHLVAICCNRMFIEAQFKYETAMHYHPLPDNIGTTHIHQNTALKDHGQQPSRLLQGLSTELTTYLSFNI